MIKITESKHKKITAHRAILTSLAVDIVDSLVNFAVAIITGSIVMFAEALRSLTDGIAIIFVYIGLKKSKKSADRDHPFGHGKSLYLWTFIAGMIMFGLVSVGLTYAGFQRFLNPKEIENILLAVIVLSFFVLFNSYSFSVGLRRILAGRKLRDFLKRYKKSNKVETKVTLTLDFVGVTTPLMGLIALLIYKLTGDLRFDGLGAMAIGIFMGTLTLFLLWNTSKLLIGVRAAPETERRIKKSIISVNHVKDVLDLKTMIVGLGKILVNAEIHVNQRLTTKQIEKLIDEVKATVKKQVNGVTHIQVEIETP